MALDMLVWLQGLRNPVCDRLFLGITELGNELFGVAIICLVYWCVCKRDAMYIGLNLLLGMLVNQWAKLLFRVPRPWVLDARVVPVEAAIASATGYSFPSGHTQNAASLFGAIAVVKRGDKRVVVCATAIMLLIAFSRLYLGVHTLWDVLFSLVAGGALLALTVPVMRVLDETTRYDILLAALFIASAAALMGYATYLTRAMPDDAEQFRAAYKAGGILIGFLCGWTLDRRFLRFRVEAPFGWQAAKFFLGMILNLAIVSLCKSPLTAIFGEPMEAVVRYGMLAFTIAYLWPLVFTKVLMRKEKTHGYADTRGM